MAKESFKVYKAISEGLINLADRFFEMEYLDAQKGLEIYKEAMVANERLQVERNLHHSGFQIIRFDAGCQSCCAPHSIAMPSSQNADIGRCAYLGLPLPCCYNGYHLSCPLPSSAKRYMGVSL